MPLSKRDSSLSSGKTIIKQYLKHREMHDTLFVLIVFFSPQSLVNVSRRI